MNLEKIYQELLNLDDYTPSSRVDTLFSKLVTNITNGKVRPNTLALVKRHKLQKICADAETKLEEYWSGRIIAGEAKLGDFPYHQNYQELTRLEWHSVHSCINHHAHGVLFIGGGPLPLTAIILALDYGVASTVLDYDQEAVKLSRALVKKLGLQKLVKIIKADGAKFSGYARFNTIFVAALAGLDGQSKSAIFRQINKLAPRGCHVLARSTWGARGLLYRPLSQSVWRIMEPVLEIRPHHEIVNSVIVFKK